MIKINGMAVYRVNFELVVDMTEEQWDALKSSEKDEIIDELIGMEGLEGAELEEADVWDLELFEGETD